jgi:hypothetical protein
VVNPDSHDKRAAAPVAGIVPENGRCDHFPCPRHPGDLLQHYFTGTPPALPPDYVQGTIYHDKAQSTEESGLPWTVLAWCPRHRQRRPLPPRFIAAEPGSAQAPGKRRLAQSFALADALV